MSQDIHHGFADADRAAAPASLHAFLEMDRPWRRRRTDSRGRNHG